MDIVDRVAKDIGAINPIAILKGKGTNYENFSNMKRIGEMDIYINAQLQFCIIKDEVFKVYGYFKKYRGYAQIYHGDFIVCLDSYSIVVNMEHGNPKEISTIKGIVSLYDL